MNESDAVCGACGSKTPQGTFHHCTKTPVNVTELEQERDKLRAEVSRVAESFRSQCIKTDEAYDKIDKLRAEGERLKTEALASKVTRGTLARQWEAAELQIRAFEEAKAKDLGELFDMIEALQPFYLHGKALRGAGRLKNMLDVISKEGVSALCAGAFGGVMEVYEKYAEAQRHNSNGSRLEEEIDKRDQARLEDPTIP